MSDKSSVLSPPQFQIAGPLVRVYCQNGHPVTYPDHLPVNTQGHHPTLIIWQADSSVAEIVSIVIHDPDDEFTQPERITSRLWLCMDKCQHDKEYKYDITVICAGSDEDQTIDPYIQNGP